MSLVNQLFLKWNKKVIACCINSSTREAVSN